MKKIQTSIAICVVGVVIVCAFFNSFEKNSTVDAQTTPTSPSDIEALRETIGNFFENLSDQSKGASKAIDEFTKNSSLGENNKIKTTIVDGLKTIHANFGEYVSYESIGVKSVGTDLLVFRYLYKCRDYPVVWYFTYYRPRAKSSDVSAGSWTLIGFRYDTNLDAALLDATF